MLHFPWERRRNEGRETMAVKEIHIKSADLCERCRWAIDRCMDLCEGCRMQVGYSVCKCETVADGTPCPYFEEEE